MPEESPDDAKIIAETAEAVRLTREFIYKVGEHACGVQVFLTKKLENGKGETWHFVQGSGNWYARYGHIRHWLTKEEGFAAREFNVPGDGKDED